MSYELVSEIELAGRELDALICERVFGLVRCQGAKHGSDYPNTYCYAQSDSPTEGGEARCYSTDINDAWEVIVALRPEYEVTLKGGGTSPTWSCEFKQPHPPHKKRYRYHYAAAHTAPLAVCRAALQAVGAQAKGRL